MPVVADDSEMVTVPAVVGPTLTPSGSTRRPIYKTEIVNALPVLRLNSDNMIGAKADFDFMHQGDSTLVFVVKSTVDTGTRVFFDSGGITSASIARSIWLGSTGKINDGAFNGVGGDPVFQAASADGGFPKDEWHIVVLRYNQGKTGDDHTMDVDGVEVASSQGAQTPSASTSTLLPTFGTTPTSGSGWVGDWAEWFGFSDYKTDEEISAMVGHLNTKYGLNLIYYVLDLGQSNSAGRAETERLTALTSYSATPAGVKIYYKTARTSPDNGSWQDVSAGVNNFEPENILAGLDCFASEVIAGKLLFDRLGNNPIYWNKCALGGTSLKQGLTSTDWSELTAGELFQIATQYYHTVAYAKLVALHPTKTIKTIILWYQGESDANNGTAASEYYANFVNFVAALRAYDPVFANAPLIITKLKYFIDANEATVNAAFDTFAGGNPNTYLIDISDQPRKQDLDAGVKATYPPSTGSDDQHSSYLAQIARGEMIFDKLVEIGYI